MAKKMKRFADGGAGNEIVVSGNRSGSNGLNSLGGYTLPMQDIRKSLTKPDDKGIGGGGGRPSLKPSDPGLKFGKVGTAAGPVYGATYRGENFDIGAGLGKGLVGQTGAPIAGVTGNFRFKKGGATKKKLAAAKKMAKGGSAASKRGDGCASKGKTKGKFV